MFVQRKIIGASLKYGSCEIIECDSFNRLHVGPSFSLFVCTFSLLLTLMKRNILIPLQFPICDCYHIITFDRHQPLSDKLREYHVC